MITLGIIAAYAVIGYSIFLFAKYMEAYYSQLYYIMNSPGRSIRILRDAYDMLSFPLYVLIWPITLPCAIVVVVCAHSFQNGLVHKVKQLGEQRADRKLSSDCK